MVCDVIWFLSNKLDKIHVTNYGRFFLSHIYHLILVSIDFIPRSAWRRNTQCDMKKVIL
jgi:hypothetical protein